MHKFIWLLSFMLTLFANALFSNLPSNKWAITAEFLYLFPTVDDTYFVIHSPFSTDFPNGKKENNDFGFHSGFKIGGVYGLCNQELQLYYSRLQTKENEIVRGDFLWATNGDATLTSSFEDFSGSAASFLTLLYQRVDGFFAQQIYYNCGLSLYLKAGFEYAYACFHEQNIYESDIIGEVNQKSRIWGIGPQFGIDFDYALLDFLCCNHAWHLSFAAYTSGSLLASDTITESRNTISSEIVLDVKDRKTWRLVPAFHARAGFNFATCLACFDGSFEIGYEMNSYIRGLSRTIFPDAEAEACSISQYTNFDVQGLYISANVTF